MRAREIREQYERASPAKFREQDKLLLICVNKTVGAANLNLIDAVRYSWKVSPERANKAEYALAVAHGLIVGVYAIDPPWLPARQDNFQDIPTDHGNWQYQKGRYGFNCRPAPTSIRELYIEKRVPDEWRSHGAPIRYVNC